MRFDVICLEFGYRQVMFLSYFISEMISYKYHREKAPSNLRGRLDFPIIAQRDNPLMRLEAEALFPCPPKRRLHA